LKKIAKKNSEKMCKNPSIFGGFQQSMGTLITVNHTLLRTLTTQHNTHLCILHDNNA